MGGWKPVDARVPASELMARWEALFARTFSTKRNEAFLEGVRKASRLGRWTGVVKGWKEGVQRAGSKRYATVPCVTKGLTRAVDMNPMPLPTIWKEGGSLNGARPIQRTLNKTKVAYGETGMRLH